MAVSGLLPEVDRRLQQALRWARMLGISFKVTSGYRSIQQQRALFARRQRGQHPLPVAEPGFSTHNYGLAVDGVVSPASALQTFVQLMECAGLRWAGPADPVHFDPLGPEAWRALLSGRAPDVRYRC